MISIGTKTIVETSTIQTVFTRVHTVTQTNVSTFTVPRDNSNALQTNPAQDIEGASVPNVTPGNSGGLDPGTIAAICLIGFTLIGSVIYALILRLKRERVLVNGENGLVENDMHAWQALDDSPLPVPGRSKPQFAQLSWLKRIFYRAPPQVVHPVPFRLEQEAISAVPPISSRQDGIGQKARKAAEKKGGGSAFPSQIDRDQPTRPSPEDQPRSQDLSDVGHRVLEARSALVRVQQLTVQLERELQGCEPTRQPEEPRIDVQEPNNASSDEETVTGFGPTRTESTGSLSSTVTMYSGPPPSYNE